MSHQSLHSLIAREHAADLVRTADRERTAATIAGAPVRARAALARVASFTRSAAPAAAGFWAEPSVTIRYGFPDDAGALARLATLDSAEVPAAPLLVAEVEGELWVALSLADGRSIGDPFRRTAPLLVLLRARAAQLCGPQPRRRSNGGWGEAQAGLRATNR
jgi:hypothetical protein